MGYHDPLFLFSTGIASVAFIAPPFANESLPPLPDGSSSTTIIATPASPPPTQSTMSYEALSEALEQGTSADESLSLDNFS